MEYFLSLNYYKDEDGEYTDLKPCNFDDVNQIVHDNWPNESYVEDLKVILITFSNQNLVLKYCKKGVYEVYYTDNNKFYYHKKSRIDLVFESATLFFDSNIDALKESLNQKPKKKKSSIHDFIKNHDYQITQSRNSKELRWFYTMGLPMAIMFLIIPISTILKGNFHGSNIFFISIISIFGLFFWLPGLLLHRQYHHDNRNLIIRLTRGSNLIHATFKGIQKTYKKDQLVKVHKFTYLNNTINTAFIMTGPPWDDYGYMALEFDNGDIINMTNLIADQLFILNKFEYDNIKKLRSRKMFPFIERKTNIS